MKKTFSGIKNFGVNTLSRIKTSFAEKRLKKEEARRQIVLMAGSIKRVK